MPRQTNNSLPLKPKKILLHQLQKQKNAFQPKIKISSKINRRSLISSRILEGRLLVTQTVNHYLESMIDSKAEYSRRTYLEINGITEPGNESADEKLVASRLKKETRIDEDVFQQNIDKIYSISEPKDEKQRRIVKFTSDSFEKRVFMKHKQ